MYIYIHTYVRQQRSLTITRRVRQRWAGKAKKSKGKRKRKDPDTIYAEDVETPSERGPAEIDQSSVRLPGRTGRAGNARE